MYLHIGGEYSLPYRTIVAVLDFDELIKESNDSFSFIKTAEKRGILENVSFDIPRSVIVAMDRIYISSIAVRTIRKRLEEKSINNI
jgi:extracellular matrix regulatory protein B